jgi:hypothetical protein
LRHVLQERVPNTLRESVAAWISKHI